MRTIGWIIIGSWVAACGGRAAGGGSTAPTPAAADVAIAQEPVAPTSGEAADAAAPADPCAAVAALMCRIQDIEGEACAALTARVAERGPDYCTNRLPATQAQVAISDGLLREEPSPGTEIPERESCPAAQQTTTPTTPDPTGGVFTIDQALADLPGQGNPHARIITRLGTLDCTLFADRAPLTVANFVGLARGLRPWWDPCRKEWRHGPFFDGLIFHRVIPGFMIQGGDVLGTGEGDPGYEIRDEFDPRARHDAPGTMSMANAGPNTGGSQFFVTEGPTPWLDDKHSVFGRCTHAGIVARIAREARDADDRPLTPVAMRVEIYR